MPGDWNAKIGKEEMYQGVIRRNSIHENSNDNGKRVVDLASGHNMVITTTMFLHKRMHLGTEHGLHRVVLLETELTILLLMQDMLLILQMQDLIEGQTVAWIMDHYLVRANYRQKVSIKPRSGRAKRAIRYEVESLKQNEIKIKYQRVLEQNLIKAKERRQRPRNIEGRWKDIRSSVIATAAEVLGSSRKRRKNSLFDLDCRNALEERRNASIKMIQNESESNIEDFKEKRRLASKLCKKRKREWINAKLKEIEENRRINEMRKFYTDIKEEKKGFQPKIGFCRGKERELISDKKILDRWVEYFEVLLNDGVESIDGQTETKIDEALEVDSEEESAKWRM
ncbi:uncharacterized protein LOC111630160 [Centruroides sculpturatus]|uniref:uncharacterized protein LOC111630160 n=1 Tax=Centruroides sculpturatus TaxID=218467 RepID=UPI000C6DB223|nr:uncharacterized protein LOC111630160 [Centruroides sculpturatus]